MRLVLCAYIAQCQNYASGIVCVCIDNIMSGISTALENNSVARFDYGLGDPEVLWTLILAQKVG